MSEEKSGNVLLVDQSSSELDSSPSIARAASLIQEDRLVAFPTETVYGLGANALSDDAVKQIFQAKGRPSDNPLIVHVASLDDCRGFVREPIPDIVGELAEKFWPGPLTIVMPVKKPSPLSKFVTCGLDSVGVRVPNHPVALALLRQAKRPVAAPSANISGKPSPTSAAHVHHDLGDKVSVILDGGSTTFGLESTVISISSSTETDPTSSSSDTNSHQSTDSNSSTSSCVPNGHSSSSNDGHNGVEVNGAPVAKARAPADVLKSRSRARIEILRPGGVTAEMLASVVGRENVSAVSDAPCEKPRAPGMKYTHYAPSAPVRLVDGSAEFFAQQIRSALASSSSSSSASGHQRVGLLCSQEHPCFTSFSSDPRVEVKSLGSRLRPSEVAHNLYASLRDFDLLEPASVRVAVIFAETFSEAEIGRAIMNRLKKAAGYSVLREETDGGSAA